MSPSPSTDTVRRFQRARWRTRTRLRRVRLLRICRRVGLAFLDTADRLLDRRDPLLPPRRLQSPGTGDFREVGETLTSALIELGSLTRHARVLDIGCGTGRTAIPLMQYLDEGTYDGLDISAAAVGWCHRTLTPRNPKFRFSVVDAANAHYNPRGTIDAAQLTFPYADDAFDFAIATSLFTHLLPAEFGNYVGEAARVLGGGGMLFATFFLLRDESLEALTRGASQLVLSASLHDSRVGVDFLAASRGSPETAVALPETFVRVSLERAGFEAVAVHPGNWADSRRGKFFQDIVICRRCAATR